MRFLDSFWFRRLERWMSHAACGPARCRRSGVGSGPRPLRGHCRPADASGCWRTPASRIASWCSSEEAPRPSSCQRSSWRAARWHATSKKRLNLAEAVSLATLSVALGLYTLRACLKEVTQTSRLPRFNAVEVRHPASRPGSRREPLASCQATVSAKRIRGCGENDHFLVCVEVDTLVILGGLTSGTSPLGFGLQRPPGPGSTTPSTCRGLAEVAM